jgi:hypothetical protein
MISPITGNVNIIADIIHQKKFLSLDNLVFRPMITATKESNVLKIAIISAINPLVKHPNTSTGINPFIKNKIETINGIMI